MIYSFVEGHGEVQAFGNLLSRLWRDVNPEIHKVFPTPERHTKIHSHEGIEKLIKLARARREISGLILLKDADDDCPKEFAPQMSSFIESLKPPFPVAYVLMYREYETLFLAVGNYLAGKELKYETSSRITLNPIFKVDFNPESKRDAKGALDDLFPGNKIYKPSLDQLPMTRLIQFEWLREAKLPCFESLERALKHLGNSNRKKVCYP